VANEDDDQNLQKSTAPHEKKMGELLNGLSAKKGKIANSTTE